MRHKKYVTGALHTMKGHWGRTHASAWVKERGKRLHIMYHCATCIAAERTWAMENVSGERRSKYAREHTDLVPDSHHICPYCESKRAFSRERTLMLHVATKHHADAIPDGWYRCDYHAADSSIQCWRIDSYQVVRVGC
jgi:hypothetical protein